MVEPDPARRGCMDLVQDLFLTDELIAAIWRRRLEPPLLPDATPVLPEFRPA